MRTQWVMTAAALAWLTGPALAASVTVDVHAIDESGVKASIGTVRLKDGKHGVTITPRLEGLAPGEHGMHVHETPDCGAKEKDGKMTAGLAAGGHLDPGHTGAHQGPQGHGHLGDLPILVVDEKGAATKPVTAPNVKVSDLKGHALMIHGKGDSFSDTPEPLGGSGPRVACGVIP